MILIRAFHSLYAATIDRSKFREVASRYIVFILPLFFLGRRPETAGVVVAFLGVAVRAWAAGHLRKDEKNRLGGPYLFVRHPLYLGSCLLSLGLILSLQSWVVLIILGGVTALTYVHTIRHEEKNLLARFGDDYRQFCRTNGPLWPKWYGLKTLRTRLRTHAHTRFSFAQYMKNREYECLAGVVTIFALLYFVASFFE